MAGKQQASTRSDEIPNGNSGDIWFECPACDKSLVVDEAGAGLIIECPQCHISVIVPPVQPPGLAGPPVAASVRPPATKVEPPPAPAKSVAPLPVGTLEVAALHERLERLAGQLRELQTQWTEITNRIASRINEVNRELVVMARLDASQKQILKEWNQIVSEIAASTQTQHAPETAASGDRRVAARVGPK